MRWSSILYEWAGNRLFSALAEGPGNRKVSRGLDGECHVSENPVRRREITFSLGGRHLLYREMICVLEG